MTFQIVHQPTRYSCMACVVAMITNNPLDQVFAELGHDGGERHFRFLECAAYLNRYGFHLGGDRWNLLFSRSGLPALLILASTNGEGNHAVFWTGDTVLDPEPTNADKKLTDYKIIEWWPISKYEG